MKSVIIGTRGSQLALWQANYTKDILEQHGYQVELNIISTKGDRTQEWNLSFDKIEGKGFFTKEIEEALLRHEADLAVHSCKDMPTENAEGLAIKAYSYRADPSDVLLIRKEATDYTQYIPLRKGAVTGTSSARRKAQILSHRMDLEVQDLRGNVPTRIEKLRSGQYDAIILAAAGIERLNIPVDDLIVYPLAPSLFIPAPAQGVLAYQVRENDEEMADVCRILHDAAAYQAVQLERDILHAFHGGCQVPLGVYARCEGDVTHLWISKAVSWDAPLFRSYRSFKGNLPSPETITQQFNEISPAKVFISRDLSAEDYFPDFLKKAGFTVEGRSLVTIEPLAFKTDGQADWLFFTSKNGVKHYFNKVSYQEGRVPKIGVLNAGTAQAVRASGYEVSFEGRSSCTATTAKEFAAIATGRVILPQANNPRGVMEKELTHCEVISLPVYENAVAAPVDKTDAAILVFTSPMNAGAYLDKYSPEPGQQLIAIGYSTEARIKEAGYDCHLSYGPMPWDLADVVMTVSAKEYR